MVLNAQVGTGKIFFYSITGCIVECKIMVLFVWEFAERHLVGCIQYLQYQYTCVLWIEYYVFLWWVAMNDQRMIFFLGKVHSIEAEIGLKIWSSWYVYTALTK